MNFNQGSKDLRNETFSSEFSHRSLADAQLSAPMSTSAFIQIQLSVVEQEKRLKEGTFK